MLTSEVFDALPAHVALLDADGIITDVNERWTRFARENGNPPGSKVGPGASYLEVCRLARRSSPAAREVLTGLENILAGSTDDYLSIQYPCHSPSEKRWFLMLASALPQARCGAVVLHLDVSADRLSHEQLSQSTNSLIVAQEEERRRVARNLHDDLNQLVATLALDLGLLRDDVPERLEEVRKEIQRIKDDAVLLSQHVRRISHELHPATLEHLGVGSALKNYCAEVAKRLEAKLHFRADGEPRKIPGDTATSVFRIAQEAVRNAIKHSGAGRIDVELKQSDQQIEVAVSDNGVGFDPESAGKQNSGLGLTSMRERAFLARGSLVLESHRDKGTLIRAVLPLRAESEDEIR